MLDHITLHVSDYPRSLAFYQTALKPLGITTQMSMTKAETGVYDGAGMGVAGKPEFWFGSAGGPASGPIHVAFAAESRAVVDAFHAAALAAGAKDNGAPGIRAHYHPSYYGAFVLDPDGNNIEAVCHKPE